MSEVLTEFGYQVRNARTRLGWTLETLSREALANPARKGYVSEIENGKRRISSRTVGKFARVLHLPESAKSTSLPVNSSGASGRSRDRRFRP